MWAPAALIDGKHRRHKTVAGAASDVLLYLPIKADSGLPAPVDCVDSKSSPADHNMRMAAWLTLSSAQLPRGSLDTRGKDKETERIGEWV